MPNSAQNVQLQEEVPQQMVATAQLENMTMVLHQRAGRVILSANRAMELLINALNATQILLMPQIVTAQMGNF